MSYASLGFFVFTAVALVFVLLPLLIRGGRTERGDQTIQTQVNQALFDDNLKQLDEQLHNGEISDSTYAKLKQELEQQLQQDQTFQTAKSSSLSKPILSGIFIATAVLVPVFAYGFYSLWGAAPDWEIFQVNINKVRQEERGADEADIRELNKELKRLIEQRLDQRDDNLHNRFLLARTYASLEEYRNALEMYQSILDLRPQSPDVVSEMAQTQYLASGGRFTNDVKALFDRAIQMSPQNIRIISFAGLAAYQAGNFQAALPYWQQAVRMSDPGTQQYQYMQQALNETQNQLRAAGIEPDESAAPITSGPTYTVSVSLADQLQLNPNYRVFIYARAWQGPRMPLAIQAVTVADLPLTLTLDESMNPGMPMKLSQFDEVELVARVSLSGNNTAQSGDWEASLGPVSEEQGGQTHRLVITSQIP